MKSMRMRKCGYSGILVPCFSNIMINNVSSTIERLLHELGFKHTMRVIIEPSQILNI